MKSSTLVFISGAAGCGKSTLVNYVKEQNSDIETLSFDLYLDSTICPPEYFEGRVVDPNLLVSRQFQDDLTSLRDGNAIIDPKGDQRKPKNVILIDENFGRLRDSIAPLVDYQIYIDLPLDVMLARRILRNINSDLSGYNDSQKLEVIQNNLKMYLSGFRDTFAYISDHLPGKSDLILKGNYSVEELAEEVISKIKDLGEFEGGDNII